MNELGVLFHRYGTDKARNDYHTIYTPILSARRHTITAVLEIGIGTLNPAAPSSMVGYAAPHYLPGGSLRAWADYFPNAQIWGIDTQPDTQLEYETDRIQTRLADSTNNGQLCSVLPADLQFDLIVDDGDHHADSQIATLHNLWPRVAPGGWYVIEDITALYLIEPYIGPNAIWNETKTLVAMRKSESSPTSADPPKPAN